MKIINNYLLILICLFCMPVVISREPADQTIVFAPQPLAKKVDPAKKIKKLSDAIKANEQQKSEIEKVVAYVQKNWNAWVKNPEFIEQYSYMRFQVTDQTHITVHPNVPEVCIFIDGHTKVLGQGAFKKAVKALTYVSEEEVAMAIPHQVDKLDFLGYPAKESPFYTDSTSSVTPAEPSSTYVMSFSSDAASTLNYYLDMLVLEAKILEDMQGIAGVIQLYFISYHQTPNNQTVPIFVGKYYNGGVLAKAQKTFDKLSLTESLLICHDLLLGLSEIHSRKIAHRDLHGGNILLEKNMKDSTIKGAYISDFGLSHYHASDLEMESDVSELKWQLKEILIHQPKAVKALELMNQHLKAKELYTRFVKLLPKMVDQETQKKIMVHAKKKLAPKIKYQNVIRWPVQQ